jgi:hypothetical protein
MVGGGGPTAEGYNALEAIECHLCAEERNVPGEGARRG